MAKKRKSSKVHHRRRRIGAVGGFDIKTPAMVAAGAIGGTWLINGPMKTSSWINLAMIGGGLLIPKFIPKFGAVGAGMVAAGGISMLQNANIISGVAPMVHIGGGPPGSTPISSIAGHRRRMGAMGPAQATALANRRQAAGSGRVIIGQVNKPISSIAGDESDEYDPCDM